MNTYLHYYEEEGRRYDRLKEEESIIKYSSVEGTQVRFVRLPINFAKPQDVSKEWAKLFLEQWNQAVRLWSSRKLFSDAQQRTEYRDARQREYASICCTWLISNGFAEPHCVAEGE